MAPKLKNLSQIGGQRGIVKQACVHHLRTLPWLLPPCEGAIPHSRRGHNSTGGFGPPSTGFVRKRPVTDGPAVRPDPVSAPSRSDLARRVHQTSQGRYSPTAEDPMLQPDDPTPPELYRNPRWYACRTRARAEKKVDARLEEVGLETFLPLVHEVRQWADRKKRIGLPLFPGFVFARFPLNRLHTVLRTPGLATVLEPNGYPTPVRDDEMESLKRLVDGVEETGERPVPADYLEVGDTVLVTSGPFRGLRGVLLEKRGRARVAVRIGALRQASSVQVERSRVQRLRGGESSAA